jgi:alpha/beta superfamily hydrolase
MTLKIQSCLIPNCQIQLEAEYIHNPQASNSTCIILTHPYSLLGGSMHNNVTSRLFNTLCDHFCLVLRFNFRGVGKSTGSATFTGKEEISDVIAVCKYVLSLGKQISQIYIVGYVN